MDGKITLTNNQIHAIEKWLASEGQEYSKKDLLKDHALTIVSESFSWRDEHKVLSELSLQDMARALFVGYKPDIPPIKEGDRVVADGVAWPKGIFTVTAVTAVGYIRTKENIDILFKPKNLRVVSQEEGFWYDIGRTQGDIKPGDVLVVQHAELYIVTHKEHIYGNRCTIDDALRWIKEGEVKGFYQAESFKKFPVKEPTT